MKLYFFSSGVLKSYRDLFVHNGGHTPLQVPVPFFLIQHQGKNILFDTGNHRDDMGKHLSPDLLDSVRPVFEEDEWAPNAIRKVGVEPAEIDFVILSHLHHDHAGAISEFKNATVIVQRSEYDYVRRPDYFMNKSYYSDEVPALDVPQMENVDWYFLNGWQDNRFDLFHDGRLILYFTPGHSVGHQSLLVKTDLDGTFLLAADACYVKENVTAGVLPGLVCDGPAYLRNIKLFRLMEKTGVKIVPGHDPGVWREFRHAPFYYE